MTVASIISIILLAVLIIVCAISLKNKGEYLALRSASLCGQLTVVMTAVLSVFLMAQESVIYNNAQTGLYDSEGIDLFYMSKASGIFCLIALAVAVLCFWGGLSAKKTVIFIPATLGVIAAVSVALWLLTKYAPNDYYAILVPAVLIEGWCLLCLAVNTLFDSQKVWCNIVIIVTNILNFLLVMGAVISVALLANGVAKAYDFVDGAMVIVLAIILLVVALPSVLTFVTSVKSIVTLVKKGRS